MQVDSLPSEPPGKFRDSWGTVKSMFSQSALCFKQEETHRNNPKTKFHECKDSVCVFIHCYSPFFGSLALGTHIMSVLFSETEGLWTRERKRDHHMTLGQDSSSHSRSVYL